MIKRFLSKLPFLNSALGDVVFETAPLKGQASGSFFQWRIKQTGDGKGMLIGMKLRPDRYAGPEGAVTNYIELSIEAAEQARADLDRCIAEYHRRASSVSINV
ncbi:hypothetical protein IHQ71_11035 [Rhizobium sp. TH2]|uniref:hypothetical protein n=1 Tax=Rhizobium sp. TH2 TaxID=2775403 RepID=UPI002157EA0F|nr:hypothetical protein [Rhizobium sp. TH2]UVC11060.1 hypothetical protein IHQ71_11035 [Rhizobium sp. TH2]